MLHAILLEWFLALEYLDWRVSLTIFLIASLFDCNHSSAIECDGNSNKQLFAFVNVTGALVYIIYLWSFSSSTHIGPVLDTFLKT